MQRLGLLKTLVNLGLQSLDRRMFRTPSARQGRRLLSLDYRRHTLSGHVQLEFLQPY